MTTPTPPGGEPPTSRIPQTPPTGQPIEPAAGTPGSPGAPGTPGGAAPHPAQHEKPKDKSLPWKIATGVLALTTIGLGAWGVSTNNKLNDLQSSTDQQIAALQQQLKQVEDTAGAKETEQAKAINEYRAKGKQYRANLKVDTSKIKQESAQINKLSNEYKSAQATAANKEGSLQAQLNASQAEAALAKKCASVMASGLLKIYEDVATIVTYREVNSVLKEASADCGDVVSVQAP